MAEDSPPEGARSGERPVRRRTGSGGPAGRRRQRATQIPRTAGELRRRLAELGNPWTVNPRLGDDDPLPNPPRGGQDDKDVPEESRLRAVAPDTDLGELLCPPTNPFLQARWVELGLMDADESRLGKGRGSGAVSGRPQRASVAESVDWRYRFDRYWITSVRNQGNSQNCWAFAATALYEAMVRIEHCLWNRRSEGDLVHGVGKQSWDLGNIGECTIFVERYGLADPDCFPWGESAALYTAKEGGANLEATPLSPTPDRLGRTVRIAPGRAITVTNPDQKRQWIDAVGPMATMINPPADFGSLDGGIYVPTIPDPGPVHALLVVGYNDVQGYWIVKNSWGTTWGVCGFGMVSYEANLLEPAAFVGVCGTNPDPWPKRRLRNGTLIQGDNGALYNNFELFVRTGANIEHWRRDNADPGLPWVHVGTVRSSDPWRDTFHDDALDCPSAVHSTFNRNFELVYRTTYRQLRHVWYDQTGDLWSDATIFGPLDPVGIPGFVQSNRGAPGDFEVVVVTPDGHLEHWTKHNSAPWVHGPGDWYLQQTFGANIAFGGPALVQSRIGVPGYPENGSGDLHYVCTTADGFMQHYARGAAGWLLIDTFGGSVTSGPCMIEGTYVGTQTAPDETSVGNFELCVAANGQIEYWSRFNATSPGVWSQWSRLAVFGDSVKRVVSLIQSTFAENLDVIVERTDGQYQHYWGRRDVVGQLGWMAGAIITSNTATRRHRAGPAPVSAGRQAKRTATTLP